MKFSKTLPVISLVSLLLIPLLGWGAQSTCDDVATRGHLNVLTINLLFSEVPQRNLRLTRIADYAKARADAGDPVDVFLLQEVVGGLLSGTANASLDLRNFLAARGLTYNLRYRMADGIPFLLTVGNAVLSRCEVGITLSQILPVVTEEPFPGLSFSVPLPREVIMTRLDVPGVGKVNVYNTHLCSYCDPLTERLRQSAVLLTFVQTVESFFPGRKRVVLGGDFNTDLNLVQDQFVYGAILGQGFTDSYAHAHSCLSCCNSDPMSGQGIAGCTYAVDDNPYANNPPFSTGVLARIDYIFLRHSPGTDFEVGASTVVFPPPPETFVSDHSAVLTTVSVQ